MASGSLGAMTDAIPLLDDAGGGVYSLGRNSARDIRVGLLNMLVAPNGASMTTRTGVMCRKYNQASTRWEDLFVRASASPTRDVIVQAGISINSRTGQGVYQLFLESDTTVTLTAANGSNPRIDLVCTRLFDKGPFAGDALHGPVMWIEEGTPSGSPVAPAVPAGAVVLAQIARAAGTPGDQITQANITDRRLSTAPAGVLRPLLPGDALADAGGYHGERRMRSSSTFVPSGLPVPDLVDMWSAVDSAWHGTQTLAFAQPAQSGSGSFPGGVLTVASLTIPDLGWPYRVEASGGYSYGHPTAEALVGVMANYDSTTWGTNKITLGYDKSSVAGTSFSKGVSCPTGTSPTLTGSHVIRLLANNFDAGVASLDAGGAYTFSVMVVPV